MTSWLFRRASTAPGVETDLAVAGGRIVERHDLGSRVERIIDLEGRPCLPGLADHHLHLMAVAAAWRSVDCSPEALARGGGLVEVLRTARMREPDGWLRGVGYDLSASGPLDRHDLDRAAAGPVRVQDRTGMFWVLDTAGLAALHPTERPEWPDGVHVDGADRPTGVLYRLDGWLRDRIGADPPELAGVGRYLVERGVVALTDATSTNRGSELAILAAAGLPQKITAMTADPETAGVDGLRLGPVKIVLDEQRLPSSEELSRLVATSHRRGRRVAVHCLDSAAVVLALTCGVGRGDRIEHASLVDSGVCRLLADSGVAVAVQPGLVFTRGDRYLDETEPSERADLHRVGSYLRAGVPLLLGSDAPHGPLDPWVTIAAAVRRTTISGREVAPSEAIDPITALGLLAADPSPDRLRRGIRPGEPADLAVLDCDWDSLDRRPSVALTMVDGTAVHSRIPGVDLSR